MDTHGREFFGPQLAGLLLNTLLYGVFLTQVHSYWKQYSRGDRLLFRCMVLYLIVAETANSVITSAIVFDPLVMRMGCSKECIAMISKGIVPDVFPSTFLTANAPSVAATSTPVQLFYAWRIYTCTRSKPAAVWIILFSLLSAAAAMAAAVKRSVNPADFLSYRWALITWLSATAVTDVSVSLCLIRFLRSHKGGFEAGNNLIDKIVLATLQTGVLPALLALLDVICFVVKPIDGTGVSFIFGFTLAKLYSNFFLSTLNARAAWNALINSKQNRPVLSFIEMPLSATRREISQEQSPKINRPLSGHYREGIKVGSPLDV